MVKRNTSTKNGHQPLSVLPVTQPITSKPCWSLRSPTGFVQTLKHCFPGLAKTKFQGFPGLEKCLFMHFPEYTPFTNTVARGQKVHIPNQFSM